MRRLLLIMIIAAPMAAHTINGVVIGPEGPVKNVRVEFHYESDPGAVGHQDVTDSEGRFSGPAPDGQILFLGAFPPASSGLETFYDGNGLKIARDYNVRIRLSRIVRISGELRDPAGRRTGGTVELYSLTAAIPGTGFRSRQSPVMSVETANGLFSVDVPGDFYSIHGRRSGQLLPSARLNVDGRRDVSGLRVVTGSSDGYLMPSSAPRRSSINVSRPDSQFGLLVTAAAGATEPFSAVQVINMMTGQSASGVSGNDGSFTVALAGAAGATLAVYHDPTAWYLPVGPNNATGAPATYLTVPGDEGTAAASGLFGGILEGPTMATVETFGALDDGQWIVSGSFADRAWSAGETIDLRGSLTLLSKNLGTDIASVMPSGSLSLATRFGTDGAQRTPDKAFFSTDLTPTGFPIERKSQEVFLGGLTITNLRSVGPGRADAEWSVRFVVPPNAPDGLYQPLFRMTVAGIPNDGRFLDSPVCIGGSAFTANGFWPLVTIGSPQSPRLFFALGMNSFDNGTRGLIAAGDRGLYQLSNHVALQGETYVVPMTDPRTGAPKPFRIEPFLPLLTGFDSMRVASPIPFDLPSGSLRVRVHRPDGRVDDLGEAPFTQMESRFVLTRSDLRPALGTAGMPAINELRTLDERFEYTFERPGLHVIELNGSVNDVWGRTYQGGGRYEIIAGRALHVDGGVVVGTPFEDGDTFAATVKITPPLPAGVEIRVLHLPGSDPSKAIESVTRGVANRFGYARLNGIRLEGAGEFRATIRATHLDAEGMMWAGETTWGSVVASSGSPVITRGRRGFQDSGIIGQQWFGFTDDGQQPGDHVMYPFHSGDVMWMEDAGDFSSGLADSPIVALQDNQGALAARVRDRRWFGPTLGSHAPFEERVTAGEIPLFSSGEAARHDWGKPDQWGYAYLYAERPSIRVREMVTEDYTPAAYWRFRDEYHFQPGVGIEGDRENDFKFQFGGAVWRDETDGFRYYGAYASLFVLIPEKAPPRGRIMPPFQGNGGGPDGGPLFELKGQDIDLFFHPTGVRPGTILHRGERVSFAGYSAPTLPSKVSIEVTSPSGVVRTIAGQASEIGYFFDPSQELVAGESGAWKAKVKIVFDGVTSGGQVTEPFPTGGVLGSREGEFYFYVVDATAPAPALSPMPQFVRPADGRVTFRIETPGGLTNTQLTYTTTMPGFILEEGTNSSLTYTYDAQKLAKDFPNLDLHDANGYAGVDTITISFLVSGTDAGGARKHFARQIVIQGEELQIPEQEPRPKRRAVRR